MAQGSSIQRHVRRLCTPPCFLALLLLTLAACAGQLPPVVPATPTGQVPGPDARIVGTVVPAPTAFSADLLALPSAFRYEVTLRPVQADASATVISGQYRDGAWAQTSRTGDQAGEELVVARDPATGKLRSYTRPAGEANWTRWPGVTFDAAYGLASPFTVLRLHPLATRSALTDNATAGEAKTQALFSTEVVQRVLMAGVLATATTEDVRASLEQQLAALFVPQTVTYWTDAGGRVVKAAATLLSLGPDNQPVPWIEFTGTYSAYDDPAIVVAAPANATDVAEAAGKDAAAAQAADVPAGVNLRVRVFASAGELATDAVVTAYQAGKKTVMAEKLGPDAQFTLKPGVYDILIRSGGAQQWLKGVTVAKGAVTSNDVLFDFAQLSVTVQIGGAMPAVDVAVFPVGEKSDFVGVVSTNPAQFRLPVGEYDVEAATQDGKARKRVTGVVLRAGLDTNLTIDLSQP